MGIPMTTETTNDQRQFEAEFARIAGHNDAISDLRRDAYERFLELGWPTMRGEAYRYTDCRPIAKADLKLATEGRELPMDVLRPHLLEGVPTHRLVFVNGIFNESLSDIGSAPDGVTVCRLADAISEQPELVARHLGTTIDWKQDAFDALNTAFVEDGLLLHVPEGVHLEQPVHVVHVTVPEEQPIVSHPRTLIIAEDGSRATCVETCCGHGDQACLVNPVTEIVAGDDVHVDHYRIVREGKGTWHIGGFGLTQGNDSNVNSCCMAMEGALIRNGMTGTLDGTDGMANLRGLAIVEGERHVDNFLRVNHMKPDCNSREYFKHILTDHGTTAFTGRIYVELDAQKTDAVQTNMNLVLSETAKVRTRPQLEIFADDVKCTHGATIGRLDEQAAFYLHARGIGKEAARSLLTFAFANEVIEDIEFIPLRKKMEALILERLPHGELLRSMGDLD